jgi:uncharacterized phage-associated protein
MTMPSCYDVARFFLSLVEEEAGDVMTNLKLQKLVYYAQGFHLAKYGKPIFPERICAWEYGPVVPNLYHALKKCGANPISLGDLDSFPRGRLDNDTKRLLTEINSVYGQFSAFRLMQLTHNEPPWKETPRGSIISHDSMRRFFRTRLKGND